MGEGRKENDFYRISFPLQRHNFHYSLQNIFRLVRLFLPASLGASFSLTAPHQENVQPPASVQCCDSGTTEVLKSFMHCAKTLYSFQEPGFQRQDQTKPEHVRKFILFRLLQLEEPLRCQNQSVSTGCFTLDLQRGVDKLWAEILIDRIASVIESIEQEIFISVSSQQDDFFFFFFGGWSGRGVNSTNHF